VVGVTAASEHDGGDAGGLRSFGDELAHAGRRGDRATAAREAGLEF
jgi:hypothetical protein